jgi:hypothetical protein
MGCWTAKRSCRIRWALLIIARCVANSRANACQLLKPQASLWALHTIGPIPSTSTSLSPFGCRAHRLLLEYDDARSGGFEPLGHVPDDRMVVLGLVTTKRGELEKADELIGRIEEGADT